MASIVWDGEIAEVSNATYAALAASSVVDPMVDPLAQLAGDGAALEFELVYLVANSIMNVTTQEEQVSVFKNAAAHLVSGGRFVIELIVPQLRRVPPSGVARVFRLDADHVGIETFDDFVGQVAWSHHWVESDGRLVRHSAPYRYIWPSELLLMAKIAGFELQDRWGDLDPVAFQLGERHPGRGFRQAVTCGLSTRENASEERDEAARCGSWGPLPG